MVRLNVGCGQTPTPGWKNYDSSWTVRFAKKPLLLGLASKLGIFNASQREFADVVRRTGIEWADVARRIPEPDGSVEVLYSSHMIEHLDRDQARLFLQEARRVLAPGGLLRLAVPNLRYHVDRYLRDNDADRLIAETLLTRPRPTTLVKRFQYLFVGDRNHQWMYDGDSLCRLLAEVGFQQPQVMEAGTTRIKEPGPLNLREREPESVFVEAVKP